MTLSNTAFIEKNKLSTTESWVVLLEITLPDDTVIRVCSNTEQITWPSGGSDIYIAFPFDLDQTEESSKGEVPSVTLKVSNAARILETYLEDYDGMVESIVKIYVVNTAYLSSSTPEIELEYEIIDSSADSMWVTFTLGAGNPFNKRFPRNKVLKHICQFKNFKGDRCQYSGGQTACNRSIDTCRNTMNNSINFGGFPGVATKGVYV